MMFEGFMGGVGWALFAAASAVFWAAIYLTNQYLRQRGDGLVFFSRVFSVVLMTPFMHLIRWPQDWRFYAAVGVTALAAVFGDMRVFDATAKYGGGVVSRVQPLVVWASFFLWIPFDPGIVARYAAHPFNTAVILAALGGCVFFARRQSRCAITRAALVDLTPALAAYAMVTVFNKYAMAQHDVAGAVYGYMFFQSVLAVPLTGLVLWRRMRKEGADAAPWATRRMALAAVLVGVGWIAHMILKNYAMAFTPNPSYLAAVSLTTPLFISLFYMAAGHKEAADVKAGMGVVACALLLALAAVRG